MKRISRTEQNDLRRPGRSRQMHRCRIDGDQQSCAANQRRQGEKIGLAGKIDNTTAHFRFDVVNVGLLERRSSTGQDKVDIVLVAGVVDDLSPSLRVPKFFRPGRTGMKNDEWRSNVASFQ